MCVCVCARAVARPAARWLLDGFNVCVLGSGEGGTGKSGALAGGRGAVLQAALAEVYLCLGGSDSLPRWRGGEEDEAPAMAAAGDAEVALSAWSVVGADVYDLLRPGGGQPSPHRGRRRAFRCVRARSLAEAEELVALAQRRAASAQGPRHVIYRAAMRSRSAVAETGEGLSAALHVVDTVGPRPLRLRADDAHGDSATATAEQRARRAVAADLLALGRVVSELSVRSSRSTAACEAPLHAARDAPLSELVAPLLAGNCKAYLLACVSDAREDYLGTVSTLRVAARARTIRSACMRARGDFLEANFDEAAASLDLAAAERARTVPPVPQAAAEAPEASDDGQNDDDTTQETNTAIVAEDIAAVAAADAPQRLPLVLAEATSASQPPAQQSAAPTAGDALDGELDALWAGLKADRPSIDRCTDPAAQAAAELSVMWARDIQPRASSSVELPPEPVESLLIAKDLQAVRAATVAARDRTPLGTLPEDIADMLRPRRTQAQPAGPTPDPLEEEVCDPSHEALTKEALAAELAKLKDEFRCIYGGAEGAEGVGDTGTRAPAEALVRPQLSAETATDAHADDDAGKMAPARAAVDAAHLAAAMPTQAALRTDEPTERSPAAEDTLRAAPAAVLSEWSPEPAPAATAPPPPTPAPAPAPASVALDAVSIEEHAAVLRSHAALLQVVRAERSRREAAEARAEAAELDTCEARAEGEAALADTQLQIVALQAKLRRLEAGAVNEGVFELYEREVGRAERDAAQARADLAATSLKLAAAQLGAHSGDGDSGGDRQAPAPLLAPRGIRKLLAESAALRDENSALRARERRTAAVRAAAAEQSRRIARVADEAKRAQHEVEAERLHSAQLVARLEEAYAALEAAEAANATHALLAAESPLHPSCTDPPVEAAMRRTAHVSSDTARQGRIHRHAQAQESLLASPASLASVAQPPPRAPGLGNRLRLKMPTGAGR